MQDKSFLIKICCLMGAILVALAVIAVIVARPGEDATMDSGNTTQSSTNTSEDTTEDTTNTTEDTTETTEETTETTETTEETEQKYNPTFDIEDNVFLDALAYTGYNIEKHRADGLMWEYVLAAEKRGKGWLSPITYGGGSTGANCKNEHNDCCF